VTFVFAYTIRWDLIPREFGTFMGGLKTTIIISFVSFALALVLGLIVALLRMSPWAPVRVLAWGYIQLFRALSLYIYVLWIYFGLAAAIGINLSPITSGIVALTILNSAYMAEIYRSALGAIDPGQREAAVSLGFGRVRAFLTVALPQAIRIAFPPLINQFVDIIKDSSIISIIDKIDLTGVANTAVSYTNAPFEMYTLLAGLYLTIVVIITSAAAFVERRLRRHLG
jgi:His/Glu/Gln/Arg/opine family amino acid ABC transporter permease subunit